VGVLEAEAEDEPVDARAEPRVVRGAHPARYLIRQGDELVARHLERAKEGRREREREEERETDRKSEAARRPVTGQRGKKRREWRGREPERQRRGRCELTQGGKDVMVESWLLEYSMVSACRTRLIQEDTGRTSSPTHLPH